VTRFVIPDGGSCVFCSILDKSIPAHVVLDDDVCLAFLDTKPIFVGHVLVVPRTHIETLPELPADVVEPFFKRVQMIAAVLPIALGAQGTFVAMNNKVSQSVPHLHVHVVPRTKGDGLKGFFWPRTKYASEDKARETAEKIASALR
jgi:histidine triad (HIT) family protein